MPTLVIPAHAGIHFHFRDGDKMDPGLRRDDEHKAGFELSRRDDDRIATRPFFT